MSLSEIHTAKNTLHEVALQAHNLAMGLQSAAPPQAQEAGPVKTVQYLLEMAQQIEKTSQAIGALAPEDEKK